MYVEKAHEVGVSYDGCNGTTDWIRDTHVVVAKTKKELKRKKEEVKKKVENISISYIDVYLDEWKKV